MCGDHGARLRRCRLVPPRSSRHPDRADTRPSRVARVRRRADRVASRGPHESTATLDLLGFAGVVLAVLGALLWLAWPELLPIGGGSDLTHHLQLIDFIDRHWRLATQWRTRCSLATWSTTRRAVICWRRWPGAWVRQRRPARGVLRSWRSSVALKAGLVFLIVRRMLAASAQRGDVGRRFAVGAVLLLFPSVRLLHRVVRPVLVLCAGRVGDVCGRHVAGAGPRGSERPSAVSRRRSLGLPASACS